MNDHTIENLQISTQECVSKIGLTIPCIKLKPLVIMTGQNVIMHLIDFLQYFSLTINNRHRQLLRVRSHSDIN